MSRIGKPIETVRGPCLLGAAGWAEWRVNGNRCGCWWGGGDNFLDLVMMVCEFFKYAKTTDLNI